MPRLPGYRLVSSPWSTNELRWLGISKQVLRFVLVLAVSMLSHHGCVLVLGLISLVMRCALDVTAVD